MKLSRKLICLLIAWMLVMPASWIYADEPASLTPSESASEIEQEQPQETEAPVDDTVQDDEEAQTQEEGAASQTPAEVPEEEAPVEEIEQEEELVRIDDEALPMAEMAGGWALVNLICMVLAAFAGLGILFRNYKDREAGMLWRKILGCVVAVSAAAVFLLTSDFAMPMVYTDTFTLPMAALALVNVAVLLLDLKRENHAN